MIKGYWLLSWCCCWVYIFFPVFRVRIWSFLSLSLCLSLPLAQSANRRALVQCEHRKTSTMLMYTTPFRIYAKCMLYNWIAFSNFSQKKTPQHHTNRRRYEKKKSANKYNTFAHSCTIRSDAVWQIETRIVYGQRMDAYCTEVHGAVVTNGTP